MSRLAPVGLAGLAAALIGVLYLEATPAPATHVALSTITRSQAPLAHAGTPTPRNAQVKAWTETILARPLFTPSRRPPPNITAASRPTATPEIPRLTGVLVSADGKNAIFAANGEDKPVIVSIGGRLGPFVVRAITAGEVTVDGPGGTETLRPVFATRPAASAQATKTPAAGASILERLEAEAAAPKLPVPPPPTIQSLMGRRQPSP